MTRYVRKAPDVSDADSAACADKQKSEGARAEKCREFAALLAGKTDIPIVMWDERRSSVEAHAILHANGKKEKKHRKTVDAVAASLILEGYLGTL